MNPSDKLCLIPTDKILWGMSEDERGIPDPTMTAHCMTKMFRQPLWTHLSQVRSWSFLLITLYFFLVSSLPAKTRSELFQYPEETPGTDANSVVMIACKQCGSDYFVCVACCSYCAPGSEVFEELSPRCAGVQSALFLEFPYPLSEK